MTRRLVVGGLLALLVGAGAMAALPQAADHLPTPLGRVVRLPERLWTRLVPPRVSRQARLADLTGPEREAVDTLARRLDGLIVWSSNRSGHHQLYLVDLRERSVRRLTHTQSVNFFSRFSPDGTKIVFLRSQRPWVSFREIAAWDVYLINTDGTGERLLAKHGYHPTWTADGRAILFQRGLRVFLFDLASGQERLIFDAKQAIPGVTGAGDFELSADGTRLAMGIRGPFDGAAVWDFARQTLIPLTKAQACQTTWAPRDGAVLWVSAEGQGGTRIMRAAAPGAPGEVFMDLPGRYSHEYFPKLSNDGRWLVWGAAAEGHEHDRADYEIFLWEVGTPWEQAVRLTYHPGNDQWPDIYVNATRAARR